MFIITDSSHKSQVNSCIVNEMKFGACRFVPFVGEPETDGKMPNMKVRFFCTSYESLLGCYSLVDMSL
jgi:hypothetical protein